MVTTKYREAQANLERLRDTRRSQDFYHGVNAFLTAARSVLYVSQYQYGWKERDKSCTYSASEEGVRRRYDAWFITAPEVAAVLQHPLTAERHDVIHHTGQAGFVHYPTPIGGLALESGTPFRGALSMRGRRIGLPLEDDNVFRYVDSANTEHDALQYCESYLALIAQFMHAVTSRPWE